MKLRAAVIGCGWIGSEFETNTAMGIYNHAAAYHACPETDLIAVCDRDPVRLQRAADRWSVDASFSDPAELFEKIQPEIVSICTPDATHFELIKAALETPSVRAILAEKPLALAVDQARELVELAEARGVAFAVNYSRRYSDGHSELHDKIRAGEFGTLLTVGGFYTKGIYHNGTHWLDLARFLVGEIVSVHGFNLLGEEGADPTLDAILKFDNGATGHLQGFPAKTGTLFEMDLLGTLGRVRVVEPAGYFATFRMNESQTFAGYRVFDAGDVLPVRNSDTVLHVVEDLVSCVRQNRMPRCSGRDGLAAVTLAATLCESARAGQRISLQ